MRRHVQLRQSIETFRFDPRSWAIELPIVGSEVPLLICETTLLLFGRATQLTLLFPDQKKVLLTVSNERSIVEGTVEQPTTIKLSRNDLEFVLAYLITWYRDGAAAVNHIDIDLMGTEAIGTDCTLVVKADQSQPPLTGEEAERILREMM